MKTRLFIAMLAVLSLVSCSKEYKIEREFNKYIHEESESLNNATLDIISIKKDGALTSQEAKKNLIEAMNDLAPTMERFNKISENFDFSEETLFERNPEETKRLKKYLSESKFKLKFFSDNIHLLKYICEEIGDKEFTEYAYEIKVMVKEDNAEYKKHYLAYEINGKYFFSELINEGVYERYIYLFMDIIDCHFKTAYGIVDVFSNMLGAKIYIGLAEDLYYTMR